MLPKAYLLSHLIALASRLYQIPPCLPLELSLGLVEEVPAIVGQSRFWSLCFRLN